MAAGPLPEQAPTICIDRILQLGTSAVHTTDAHSSSQYNCSNASLEQAAGQRQEKAIPSKKTPRAGDESAGSAERESPVRSLHTASHRRHRRFGLTELAEPVEMPRLALYTAYTVVAQDGGRAGRWSHRTVVAQDGGRTGRWSHTWSRMPELLW